MTLHAGKIGRMMSVHWLQLIRTQGWWQLRLWLHPTSKLREKEQRPRSNHGRVAQGGITMYDFPIFLICLASEQHKRMFTAYGGLFMSNAAAKAHINWFLSKQYPNVEFAIIKT